MTKQETIEIRADSNVRQGYKIISTKHSKIVGRVRVTLEENVLVERFVRNREFCGELINCNNQFTASQAAYEQAYLVAEEQARLRKADGIKFCNRGIEVNLRYAA